MYALKKNPHVLLMTVLFLFVFTPQAFSWQITLSDVDGTLVAGETYEMTVTFSGDVTDHLSFLSYAFEFDQDILQITALDINEYEWSDFPSDLGYKWSQFGSYSYLTDSSGALYRFYNIMGQDTIDRDFYPEVTGNTLLATLTFTALESGYFTDMATFYYSPDPPEDSTYEEFVTINGETYDMKQGELSIWKDGSASVIGTAPPAPVPEPATMLLMGTGLLGLAGFRRKFFK